jgi:hypothetical protein
VSEVTILSGMYVRVRNPKYHDQVGRVIHVEHEYAEVAPLNPLEPFLMRLPYSDLQPLINFCTLCGRHDQGEERHEET